MQKGKNVITNKKLIVFLGSLSGLHETEAFKNEIENDSLKSDLYDSYRDAGSDLSKQCN